MSPVHSKIRSVLRRLWLYSEPRREALRLAKHPGRGNGYACAICLGTTKKPEVDHVCAVGATPGSKNTNGATWDQFIERLFCPASGLRILCGDCHATVTLMQRQKQPSNGRKGH